MLGTNIEKIIKEESNRFGGVNEEGISEMMIFKLRLKE